VLANVALMNFCYAVPVKLFSTSMVVSAAVLVAFDARRILGALGIGPSLPPPSAARWSRRARIARGAVKLVLVGGVIASSVIEFRHFLGTQATPVSPVHGTWQVQSWGAGGAPAADPARWRRVVVDAWSVAIRFEDEQLVRCSATHADAHRLELDCRRVHKDGALRWRLDGDLLVLEGTFDHVPITASLKRLDDHALRLLSTTFQWTFD